ncbi:MAG TPA: hypothetical protein VK952_00450, partial [Methylotenera sp.]|nr:hypothetical protein [Methylotenera sp.]
MKSLLKQFFGNASLIKSNQHKAWLADLKDLDDLAALQLSTRHLTQFINPIDTSETLTLSQQLDFIFELEAINQGRLEKLSAQLAYVENMKVELENSIFDTCYNYCRQSYIFHLKLIEQAFSAQINNAGKGEEATYQPADSTLVLLIARALYTAFNMVKWRLFSQTNPPT